MVLRLMLATMQELVYSSSTTAPSNVTMMDSGMFHPRHWHPAPSSSVIVTGDPLLYTNLFLQLPSSMVVLPDLLLDRYWPPALFFGEQVFFGACSPRSFYSFHLQ